MSGRTPRAPLGAGLDCRTLGAPTPAPDAATTSVFEPLGGHGSGVPLIAAPPLGLDGRCFSRLAPLAQDRRTVFWNFPNRLPTTGGAEALGQLLLTHLEYMGLGESRRVLMGGSLGGAVSMCAALAAPQRTAGLILMGTCAAWRDLGWMLRTARYLFRCVPRRSFHEFFAQILVPGRQVSPDAEALRDQMRHRTKRHVGAIIDRLIGEGPYDLRATLAELDAPILVLHGELDNVIQPRALEAFEALPRARVVTLPGVRHLPQVSAPDRCLEEIGAFLAEIDSEETER